MVAERRDGVSPLLEGSGSGHSATSGILRFPRSVATRDGLSPGEMPGRRSLDALGRGRILGVPPGWVRGR